MGRIFMGSAMAMLMLAGFGMAQEAPSEGPYKVLKTAKVGGDGGFDYVYADDAGRRLYIPRTGPTARINVFNLDTLESVGQIGNANARGAAVDPKSGHGFGSSKPVVMWDTKTLATIKNIDVEGGPDGILFDPFNARVYVFSHRAPNATVINAADGSVAGTIDLGGAPEQAVTDGNGHLYVDIEDKDNIAVVDAKTMTVTAHYDLAGKCGGPGGLAFDVKNHVLFAACHEPQVMVILSSVDGKIITSLPIGNGVDGAVFNPETKEAFSSQRDGTLTVIKENSPTSFVVEQTVKTMQSAKTLTLDSKTNHILLIAAEFTPPPPPARGSVLREGRWCRIRLRFWWWGSKSRTRRWGNRQRESLACVRLFCRERLVDPEASLRMEGGVGLPGGAGPAVDGLGDGEGIVLGLDF
jgi:DNA-binding beta-propeller fold protein YncE